MDVDGRSTDRSEVMDGFRSTVLAGRSRGGSGEAGVGKVAAGSSTSSLAGVSCTGGSAAFGNSGMLGIVSVSFAVVAEVSEPTLDPTDSAKEAIDGGEAREEIERLPESSRTRSWVIEGFGPPASGEDTVGVESPLICIAGVGRCSDRINCSTRFSILYCLVPKIEPVLLFALVCFGRGTLPGSSPSSLISCSLLLDAAGEAVCRGKEAAREVSLSSSATVISRSVS